MFGWMLVVNSSCLDAYSYSAEYGHTFNGDNYQQRYGKYIKANDVIDVWLDLKDNHTLCYGKNQVNYGKAWDIPCDKKYRFALAVSNGVTISIKKFQVFYS